MSASINPNAYCPSGCDTTTSQTSKEDKTVNKSLITIIILIVVIYLFGGRVFGGYGNYPGYGGYSIYGYTPYKPKRYRYFDDYFGYDEPDF